MDLSCSTAPRDSPSSMNSEPSEASEEKLSEHTPIVDRGCVRQRSIFSVDSILAKRDKSREETERIIEEESKADEEEETERSSSLEVRVDESSSPDVPLDVDDSGEPSSGTSSPLGHHARVGINLATNPFLPQLYPILPGSMGTPVLPSPQSFNFGNSWMSTPLATQLFSGT